VGDDFVGDGVDCFGLVLCCWFVVGVFVEYYDGVVGVYCFGVGVVVEVDDYLVYVDVASDCVMLFGYL